MATRRPLLAVVLMAVVAAVVAPHAVSLEAGQGEPAPNRETIAAPGIVTPQSAAVRLTGNDRRDGPTSQRPTKQRFVLLAVLSAVMGLVIVGPRLRHLGDATFPLQLPWQLHRRGRAPPASQLLTV
ncbi:MAG: hypothetical protein ACRDPR_04585 [Nocardioidaceae bacterium]